MKYFPFAIMILCVVSMVIFNGMMVIISGCVIFFCLGYIIGQAVEQDRHDEAVKKNTDRVLFSSDAVKQ